VRKIEPVTEGTAVLQAFSLYNVTDITFFAGGDRGCEVDGEQMNGR